MIIIILNRSILSKCIFFCAICRGNFQSNLQSYIYIYIYFIIRINAEYAKHFIRMTIILCYFTGEIFSQTFSLCDVKALQSRTKT